MISKAGVSMCFLIFLGDHLARSQTGKAPNPQPYIHWDSKILQVYIYIYICIPICHVFWYLTTPWISFCCYKTNLWFGAISLVLHTLQVPPKIGSRCVWRGSTPIASNLPDLSISTDKITKIHGTYIYIYIYTLYKYCRLYIYIYISYHVIICIYYLQCVYKRLSMYIGRESVNADCYCSDFCTCG